MGRQPFLSGSEEMQVLDLYRRHNAASVATQLGIKQGLVESIVKRHRREVGYFKQPARPLHPGVPVHSSIPFEKIGHRGKDSSPRLSPFATNPVRDALGEGPFPKVERPLWGGSHRNQNRMALSTTLALLRHEMSECSLKLENFDSELETLNEMRVKIVEAQTAVLARQDALAIAGAEVEALMEEAE